MPIVYPHRVQIDASNQPTAAQNYEHGTTAETGMVAPASALTDGDQVLLLAEEVDADGNPAGAWEVCRATWTDSTTDYFGSRSLVASSSGSLIDWSAAGVNATPRLTVLSGGDDSARWAAAGWEPALDLSVVISSGVNTIDWEDLDVSYDYLLLAKLTGFTVTASFYLGCTWGKGGGTTTWATNEISGSNLGYAEAAARDAYMNATSGYVWARAPITTSDRVHGTFLLTGLDVSASGYATCMFRSNNVRGAYGGVYVGNCNWNDGANDATAFRLYHSNGSNVINAGQIDVFRRPASLGVVEVP